MATIDDLIHLSGYSRSTVFRFLAGKPVRDAARDAIRTAIRETGFKRGQGDQRDGDMLLVSVPADFRGFRGFADVVEEIMVRAAERGIPISFDEGQCAGKRVAALILGKSQDQEDKERQRRTAAGVPCVLVNRYVEEDPAASWVSVDFRAAAAEAITRLVAAGCRRVACYGADEGRRVNRQKLDGARRRAEEAGIGFTQIDPSHMTLEVACDRLLTGPDRVDGWLSLNDVDAMRVIGCAFRLGISVPAELSVIGMNDVEGAAYALPPITTVRIPFRECGVSAVDAALRLMDHPTEISVKIILRHRLIERGSCAPIQQKR